MESREDKFAKELKDFILELNSEGLLGALRYLNKRTAHRYTGIYRYEGKYLINIVKYDKYTNHIVVDDKVPLEVTYCSLVKDYEELTITDATTDKRVKDVIKTPVVSYGGVLIRDEKSRPFGTLCHYDFKRCQEKRSDIPLLKSASSILYEYIKLEKGIRA